MFKSNNFMKIDNRPIRFFDNAQEVWLWFCFCEMTPKSGSKSDCKTTRPCETSDVAIIVKRLVRDKILTQEHLKVLSLYGLKQMPPYEKCGDPIQHCALWKQALQRILEPLKVKGIVCTNGTAF